MSTVYIIKDGIIVDSLIATATYRDERGMTVKPATYQEEQELIRMSENNVKIKELKEDIRSLEMEEDFSDLGTEYAVLVGNMLDRLAASDCEKFCPGKLEGLFREWNEAAGHYDGDGQILAACAARIMGMGRALEKETCRKQLEWTEAQNHLTERIRTDRKNIQKLEMLMFQVPTSEGLETAEALVDERTRGELERIREQLDELSQALPGYDMEQTMDGEKKLSALEGKISQLPEQARQVFTTQLWREEQAQNVAEKLADAGWQIGEISEGRDMFDDLYIGVKNVSGDRAVITFSINGEVRIDSFFKEGNKALRTALQQTVLGALVDGGAVKASGQCMNGEDGEADANRSAAPDSRTEEAEEALVEQKAAAKRAAPETEGRQQI